MGFKAAIHTLTLLTGQTYSSTMTNTYQLPAHDILDAQNPPLIAHAAVFSIVLNCGTSLHAHSYFVI